MQNERGAVFNFLENPLVWVGVILTAFTLHYEGEQNAFELFLKPETYRNLAIGAVIYVGLFDRHYTKNRERIDWMHSLFAVIEAMYIIFFAWFGSLFLMVSYYQGGEMLNLEMRRRYQKSATNGSKIETFTMPKGVLEAGEYEAGKSYKITPQADGSFVVEVISE